MFQNELHFLLSIVVLMARGFVLDWFSPEGCCSKGFCLGVVCPHPFLWIAFSGRKSRANYRRQKRRRVKLKESDSATQWRAAVVGQSGRDRRCRRTQLFKKNWRQITLPWILNRSAPLETARSPIPPCRREAAWSSSRRRRRVRAELADSPSSCDSPCTWTSTWRSP